MNITGTPNNDVLNGTADDDVITGLVGNDQLRGLAGNDTLDGGDGRDRLEGGDGNDILRGGVGDDSGYVGFDAGLIGGAGDDQLFGETGNDELYGEAGNDTLNGGEGDDYLDPGTGIDTVIGGAGNDKLNLNLSTETSDISVTYTNPTEGTVSTGTMFREVEQVDVTAGSGNDTINLSGSVGIGGSFNYGSEVLSGSGNDSVTGGTGSDAFYGQAGNDTLEGGASRDRLEGGDGDDILRGGAGDDNNNSLVAGVVYGGLYGGAGNDLLDGGEGDDYLDPGMGIDTVIGGAGNDLLNLNLSISTDNLSVTYTDVSNGTVSNGTIFNTVERINLTTGSGNDSVDLGAASNSFVKTGLGSDAVQTGAGRDRIEGGDGDDILRGGAGDDSGYVGFEAGLIGGAGNDQLFGEAGDDFLDGGDGVDIIDGGAGNDTAVLNYSAATTPVILNYSDPNIASTGGNDTLIRIENVGVDSGSGNDIINISAATGLNAVRAGAGNDTVIAGAGRDYLEGGDGDDILRGGAGDDNLFQNYPAGVGGTILRTGGLYGGAGNDQLFGEAGDDFLDGGDGVDIIDGGAGNDTAVLNYSAATTPVILNYSDPNIASTGGNDTLIRIENVGVDSGSGNDIINISAATGLNAVRAGAGNDTVIAGAGRDYLEGGDGDDILRGGAGDDNLFQNYPAGVGGTILRTGGLYGGAGNDQLFGEAGDDNLFGEAGNDVLVGVDENSANPGLGEKDTLSGGAGGDRFILGTSNWIAYDDRNTNIIGNFDYAIITDFSASEDKVQLQGSASNYRLVVSGADTNLYLDKAGSEPDELIAIFQNTAGLNLTSAAFEYVAPITQIAFANNAYSVNENGTASITLVRNGNVDAEVSATVTLSNGTATATADYTNTPIAVTFAVGETSQTITVPIVDDSKFELNETINLALTNLSSGVALGTQNTATLTIVDNDVALPGTLQFSTTNFRVSEDGTAIAAVTVTRTGGSDGAISATISLTNGTATAGSDYTNAPIAVAFADGETSKTITVPILDDAFTEATETINLSLGNVTGGAAIGSRNTATLSIVDDEVQLNFSAANYIVREDGTAVTEILVTRSGRSTGVVGGTIAFTNGTATGCSCGPNSVNNDFHNGSIAFTLADGETSKLIAVESATLANSNAIRMRNDDRVEGDEFFTISLIEPTGGAMIGNQGSATVKILDDDVELAFGAPTFRVREDGTAFAEVTVVRNGRSSGAVGASLTLADGSAKAPGDYDNAPIPVSLADGETRKTITIPVKTDLELEIDETINLALTNPTGGASLGTQDTAVLTVVDLGVAPVLTVAIAKDTVAESAGNAAATGTITRSIVTADPLTVTLASSDVTEATVPTTVTILGGQATATFAIDAVNDNTPDGVQPVTITASATGYNNGFDTLNISDINVPDLVTTSLSAAEPLFTGKQGTYTYRVENRGLTATSGTWADRVYLSADNKLDGTDTLLSENSITANIPVGSFYERTIPFFVSKTPGNYYLIASTDAANAVNEGGGVGDSNNTLITPISITPAYRASVSTNTELGIAGNSVVFNGRALSNADNTPIAFEFVKVGVKTNGILRELDAFTDGNGNFSATFNPLPGEAGRYQVNAYFPGNPGEDSAPEDTFSLLGMRFNSSGATNKVLADQPFSGQVNLQNLTDIGLTGITASIEGAPADWMVQVNAPQTLAGDGTNAISYTILAPNSSQIVQDNFNIRLTSAEGATALLPVQANLERIVPRLVAEFPTLTSGMLRGQQTAVEFTVTNQGGAASGEVQVLLPDAPWLKLASPVTIPSLAPGQSTTVTLLLTPQTDLPLTVYNGNLVFDGPGNDGDLTLPFNFRAVSEAVGSLRVNVVDELFYFTEEKPKLANAEVTLRDYFTGNVIRTITTDATGMVAFDQLTEGAYTLEVKADKHETFKQTVQIDAGENEVIDSFLSRQTVQYIWNVTPTEIQDKYNISVESVFETNVPVPTVTIDPPEIDLASLDVIGEVMQIDMTVTNHGLIAANDVKLNFGSHPFYKIEPLIEKLDILSAKSSLKIPVKLTRIANFDTIGGGTGSGGTGSGGTGSGGTGGGGTGGGGTGGGGTGGGGNPSVPCGLSGVLIWSYICGPTFVSKSSGIAFNNVDGNTGCGMFGGGGGGGGSLWGSLIIGLSSCDPCDLERLQVLTDCFIDFIPLPEPLPCIQGASDCIESIYNDGLTLRNSFDCVVTAIDCAGKLPGPLGNFITVVECIYDLLNACNDLNTSSNGLASLQLAAIANTSSEFGFLQEQVERLQKVVDSQAFLFGDDVWFERADSKFSDWVNVFLTKVREASSNGEKISLSEQNDLLTLAPPGNVVGSDVNRFIDRWNRTIDYWNAGIFKSTDVPDGQNSDFIALDVWRDKLAAANAAISQSQAKGFVDISAEIYASLQEIKKSLEPADGDNGVCAKVRIKIDQDAVMTRAAFLGELEIDNGGNSNLENISVNLQVKDAQGNIVNNLFGITNPILKNITAVNGTGILTTDNPATPQDEGIGSASWTFIPTNLAAPETPTQYSIGGTLSYVENGQTVTVPLLSTPVTVYPQAELHLDYFHERNVYADDPFTDPVETSVPYSLGVMVRNEGKGTAKNLEITSAQPKIIENEKGLLIDFQLLGTRVGTQSVSPSLTANFGNIAPNQTVVADWLFKSSLQGKFIEYKADFKHVNDLGNPELSLIKSTTIHELIRKVRVNHPTDDNLPDFLVNDVFDANFDPDTLYFSNGTKAPVNVIRSVTADGVVNIDDLEIQLTATTTQGWSYLRLNDPGSGQFQIKKVLRSDGSELRTDNYWTTDRTFPATGRPIAENILHLLDFNSTGTYTVLYTTGDEAGPQVRDIVDVDPDPRNTPITSIEVVFTEPIKASSFDYTDLSLKLDGGANLITAAVTISQVNPTTFRINNLTGLTGNVGQYQLSINASGIQDLGGIAGAGTANESWLFTGDKPAIAEIIGLTSNLRNVPVDFIDVRFTEEIDPASFDAADILLTRGEGGNLINNSVTFTQINGTTYRISNLSSLTSPAGNYELLLTANGVRDTDGNSGIGGRGFNWTMDTGSPTVLDVIDLAVDTRQTPVQELDVVFSKPIDLTSFDTNDLALIRNNTEVVPLSGATIELVSGSTYRVKGLAPAQTQDGTYNFTVTGSGISDTAGNFANGTASEQWTLDRTAPIAPTSITITPDRGISDNDLITNTTDLTVSGTLAEPGLSVFLIDKATGDSLGQATVNGTSFSHPVSFAAGGNRQLEVKVVDAAGNSSSRDFDLFLDLTKPAIASVIGATTTSSPIPYVDITFTEAIHPNTFFFNDISLTRDGGANLITNAVTITQLSGTTYRINGLSSLTQTLGSYELAIDANGIQDRAGNSGDTRSRTTFAITPPPTPGILLTQSSGSTAVTEGGADTYTLVLKTQPTANVIVTLAPDTQTSTDKTTLTFTPENWNTPQTVIVTAINDTLPEGTHTSTIQHTLSSTDANYSSLTIPNLAVAVTDNDAEIRGTLWNDLDGDGVRDTGEAGLTTWTVFLDANSNGQLDSGERSTQTDASGNYRFDDLRPGTYTVTEVLQPAWKQTFPGVGISTTGAEIPIYTPSLPNSNTSVTSTANTSASHLIGLDTFHQDPRFASIDGSGFASVIIDTGIDLNHLFFGADANGDGVGDRIVYQYDFADNDSDASDKNGHGSHVASIIGSSDSTYTGIAPAANLIALKVFKDNGSGYFSDLEESLQWVINNAAAYNIASVNLSLGDERNWNTATGQYGIGDELAALTNMGIIISAAAGNNFATFGSKPGVAYPAADPNVLAVGALLSNTGQIADFSQRDAKLTDIFAPGIPIVGANATDGTTTMGGTSQAAPFISGIAVLAQELAVDKLGRKLTVSEFHTLLTTTGVIINDGDDEVDNVSNTGLNFPHVNMMALAEAILTFNGTSSGSNSSNTTSNGTNTPLSLPSDALSLSHTVTLKAGQTVTGLNFGNHQITHNTDFDQDGQSDLVWRNYVTGQNVIWLMNGTNLSQDFYITPVTDLTWSIAGTGDFNQDGQSDLVWRNGSAGKNAVWLMNGTNISQGIFLNTDVPDANWRIANAYPGNPNVFPSRI
jgi:Ca2+-binding RTX toxin-like protein